MCAAQSRRPNPVWGLGLMVLLLQTTESREDRISPQTSWEVFIRNNEESSRPVREHRRSCSRSLRAQVWFTSRLWASTLVPQRSVEELLFTQAYTSSLCGSSLSSGRFRAPISGLYLLNANLLIESDERAPIRAAICVQDRCEGNMSVTSVISTSGPSTVVLTGTLYLQSGQYVSVLMDNGSETRLSVQGSSVFSGVLLGV
ncbi:unnamed protein product [Knipowitschia caucasica]